MRPKKSLGSSVYNVCTACACPDRAQESEKEQRRGGQPADRRWSADQTAASGHPAPLKRLLPVTLRHIARQGDFLLML